MLKFRSSTALLLFGLTAAACGGVNRQLPAPPGLQPTLANVDPTPNAAVSPPATGTPELAPEETAIGPAWFENMVSVRVGDHPTSLAAGDFDNDGDLDLAVTNDGNGSGRTISIVEGRGREGLVETSSFTVGVQPIAVIAGDWDADDDLDLAVANHLSDDVVFLSNDGTGDFSPGARVPMPDNSFPFMMASGDFDRDGDVDVGVASFRSGGSISILSNAGDGTFTETSTTVVGGNPYSVESGDFDRDGDADLAVSGSSSDMVTILRNEPGRGLAVGERVPVGDEPWKVIAGDFDADQDLDLAVANKGSNDVSILHNDGAGGFMAVSSVPAGEEPYSVAAGDFDQDGDLDLAVANEASGTLTIAAAADGTFVGAATIAAGDDPWAVVAQDFDGDGVLDLAVANAGSDTISIFRRSPGGR